MAVFDEARHSRAVHAPILAIALLASTSAERAHEIRPRLIEQEIQGVMLSDLDGREVGLRALVAQQPTVLSDDALTASRKLGLTYKAKPADFGSEAFHQTWRARQGYGATQQVDVLPMPAVYLVSKRGRIIYQYVNIDDRVRLSDEVLLTAARAYGTGG